MDIASTKMTNTIATNYFRTASINCYSKKVRDCNTDFHAVLLVIVLLLITIIICYYYAKQKRYKIKWKIMNFKKFVLKIVRFIISIT